jgi:hydroxymethylbilane synthase
VKKRLVVGTRGSKLAMVQTESVVAAIKTLNPQVEVAIEKIVTSGDRDHFSQMYAMGTAVFVKELEEALLDGRIDLAVHSLKDMPTELPDGLGLIAVPQRADPRDVLVSRATLAELPSGANIGTGSLRRAVQLPDMRSDLKIVSIRGNVDTRVGKVSSGAVDAVILAAAGLSRLAMVDKIKEYLPPERFLPAVGQGALAVEGRLSDRDTVELVAPLSDAVSRQSVAAERAFLLGLGGGCRAPVAALASIAGNILTLRGMAASADGKIMLKDIEEGIPGDAEEIGRRMAQRMLENGASDFIK